MQSTHRLAGLAVCLWLILGASLDAALARLPDAARHASSPSDLLPPGPAFARTLDPASPADLFDTTARDARPGPRDLDELKRDIEEILQETGTPGAAVALVEDGRLSWSAGLGRADVARGVAVTPDTLFRVGSISKTLVSMAVLKLVEEGRLRLDQPVRELVPEVAIDNPWESEEPVRVVHLLQHTAGFDDWHLCELAHNDPAPLPLEKGLAFNPSTRRVRWKPGTHFAYSNAGPPVAARIVEKLTGERFEEYMARTFLRPLEMEHADFFLTDRVSSRLARGYKPGEPVEVPYWHMIQRPSGALNASVTDLGRMVEMMLGDGTFRGRRLLDAASIQQMYVPTTSRAARAGLKFGYGLGTFTNLRKRAIFLGHDGGMPGYLASYGLLPGRGLGYAVVLNSTTPALAKIQLLLRNYLLDREQARLASPRPALDDDDDLQPLAGTYRFASPRAGILAFLTRWVTLEVRYRDGRLFLAVPGGDDIELIPVTRELFRVEGSPVPLVAIVRDPDGNVYFQTGFSSFVRVSTIVARLQELLMRLVVYLLFGAIITGFHTIPALVVRSRSEDPASLKLKLLPFLTVVCLIVWWQLFASSGDLVWERFGKITIWSLAAWVLAWLYPLLTIAGLKLVITIGKAGHGGDGAWTQALFVSLANLVVVLYLGYYGIVGLRTWAY